MDHKVYVDNEIGQLQRVIVHDPDSGIARISPKNAEVLLFDDIVHLPQMVEEHKVFTDLLKAFIGKDNVLYTRKLMEEALAHSVEARENIIRLIVDFEELPSYYFDYLAELNNHDLALTMISGYHVERDHILFDPVPNFIFTRDVAVVIKDHVIITKASKEARHRENLLSRFIFFAHPIFNGMRDADKIINLNHVDKYPPSKRGVPVSAEGGDMMSFYPDYFFIGCSERTTAHAIDTVRDILFEHKVVDNVVRINIPPDRSFMHIDTLFTHVDHDLVVCYKPIIYDGLGSNVEVFRRNGKTAYYSSVKDFFLEEINPDMRFVFSGMGESPYQEREQWTDGCNLVAIKPGVAITYDRNIVTARAFRKAGYTILDAPKLLRDINEEGFNLDDLEKTIITLPSSELSRARGGSHCMTCPIERMPIH